MGQDEKVQEISKLAREHTPLMTYFYVAAPVTTNVVSMTAGIATTAIVPAAAR